MCVTLGHGRSEPVAQHYFYGSELVLKDLERLPGYSSGLLHFCPGPIVRSPDGRVVGFSRQHLLPPQTG